MNGSARTYHLRVQRSQKRGDGGPTRSRQTARRVAPSAETLTIAQAIDHYLRLLPTLTSNRGRPYSPATITKYAENLRPFAAACGDRPLGELDADLVAEHLAGLRGRGLAQWTIATRDSVLRAWLAWCLDRGWVRRSPLQRVRRQTAQDPPIERLTDAEVLALVRACDRDRWGGVRDAAILYTLWRTGLRVSEVCALDLADYDGPEQRLWVRHGKGDKPRLVGVPEDAAAALDDWIVSARGTAPGPLFPSALMTRFARRNLALALTRVAKRAGIAGVHPHKFRHTFAVNWLTAGGDLYTLKEILGHSTLAMTLRYLRAIQAEEAAAEHVRVLRFQRRGGEGRRR